MVGDDFKDNTYKKYGLAISLVLHAILLIYIFFYTSLTYDFPPPGKEGILVVFGDTQESSGEDLKRNSEDTKENTEDKKENSTEIKNKEEKKNEEKLESKVPEKFVKDIDEDNDNPVLDSKKTKTKPEQKSTEQTQAQAKSEFSKLFSARGTKKNTNGVQGDPLGSRDAKMLEGITRGKGEVGEGLDSRGILYEPNFEDASQKSGRVVVKVCINETGNVVSAKYTQRGSSTTDLELIGIAEKNAKKYRFTPSNKKRQCGTITIDFIVK